MLVCVGKEEGYREHFEDGGGVSTMSVRIKAEMAQRKGVIADRTSFCVCDMLARRSG